MPGRAPSHGNPKKEGPILISYSVITSLTIAAVAIWWSISVAQPPVQSHASLGSVSADSALVYIQARPDAGNMSVSHVLPNLGNVCTLWDRLES
jgi:hypothetical protein